MPDSDFEPEYNDDGRIIDFLDGTVLDDTPEERVRQVYLQVLHFELGYPKSHMRREVGIYSGHAELTDDQGHPIRADIVVYRSAAAAAARDQGQIKFVVECKRPDLEDGRNQLVSYIYLTSAAGGVWTNGEDLQAFRRLTQPSNALDPAPAVPKVDEEWDSVGRPAKADLRRPRDVRRLLRLCHNKLHGRGIDSDDDDLTMDMVRIILAKAQDEIDPGEFADFYCTPEEYGSAEGRAAVARRVQALFGKFADNNRGVFKDHEEITVSPAAIAEVVSVLQPYTVMTRLEDADEWDIMGSAYEQYTATHLKRQRGQFFTNRLVVEFMVTALDPDADVKALDPAGGSGGFLTSVLRHVRHRVLDSNASATAKEHQLANLRQRLYLVDVSTRLVKIAKTAMLLNGDGHSGMTQGNSLGPYDQLDDWIKARCSRGEPNLIVTNPPFAGVGEGVITDPVTLDQYRLARRWGPDENGELNPIDGPAEPRPPELLFVERCLDWLAPGGRLGIVLPKSFLDTATYRPARELLARGAKILGVVNLHKNTFQPDTGVRTCVVLIEKLAVGETVPADHEIFMAISRKIGRDSEGRPIYVRDEEGHATEDIDHDLGVILEAYQAARAGTLTNSAYTFTVPLADIPTDLNINPQFHLPHLNETLRRVQEMDSLDGWSVGTVGNLDTDIEIFKGPRLRTENILVDDPGAGPEVEPYYTPSAVLQDKRDSVKWLDLARATERQIKAFEAVRVQAGDLLVTRSGSIGRIAYITQRLDGAIVSDDAIRVRIEDEDVRAYVYAYLSSDLAQDQLKRNEYGAVQQHLEPAHVRDLAIPVPDDWAQVQEMIDAAKEFFAGKEAADAATERVFGSVASSLPATGAATPSTEAESGVHEGSQDDAAVAPDSHSEPEDG